ncbi:capsular polysaccharide biosynthesis protein [Bacteroidia bacterium]|nr:capsular polysaccharide biosynthesis protein [Bacteroidia bacterium]
MKYRVLFLVVWACYAVHTGRTQEVTLLFAGDAMQHQSQLANAYRNGFYDYSSYFGHIRDEVLSADIAVVNLEVTLGGPPYAGYPQFSAPDEFAYALRDAGFNLFLNANNHILDRGSKGVFRTLDRLDSMKIVHTGVFRNEEERNRMYPLMFMKGGIRFAILNYTYGTNGIAVPPPVYVNYIDKEQIRKDVQKAYSLNADIIIANMHWGDEYKLVQNREQEDLAAFMAKEGINLVIGSHPHVVQPSKVIADFGGRITHVITYSLGNFVSGMIAPNTDGGQVVKIVLEKQPFRQVEIKSAEYALVFRNKERVKGKVHFSVIPVSMAEKNDTVPYAPAIGLEPASYLKMTEFAKSARWIFNRYNVGIGEYKMGTPKPEINNYNKFSSILFAN